MTAIAFMKEFLGEIFFIETPLGQRITTTERGLLDLFNKHVYFEQDFYVGKQCPFETKQTLSESNES